MNTNELGIIIRALKFNPSQAEIKEMEKEVDPNETGSFDQINLISLIARRPKPSEELEEMMNALKTFVQAGGGGDDNSEEKNKIPIENLKFSLQSMGEALEDHEILEIMTDITDLIHEEYIMIDVLANYLMAR